MAVNARMRSGLIAGAQSLGCLAVGGLMFLVAFGFTVEEFADRPPRLILMLVAADACAGFAVSVLIGPLRLLRPGPLHTALHLLIAAAAGLSSWALPASTIALIRLGRNRRLRIDVGAVVALSATTVATLLVDAAARDGVAATPLAFAVGLTAVIAAVPLLIGRVLGTRQALLRSLRDRAVAAEREREAADREREAAEREREAAQREREAAEREAAALVREHEADIARIRAEERAALARDMHDSVSHQLATIAMHAGAITYREDLTEAEVRRAAGTVRDAAQAANRELREVLVALRSAETDADTDEPLATVPTLDQIADRARKRGADVTLTFDGLSREELAGRSRGTVVALARILSEAVTNAAKHAPGVPVFVLLQRDGDQLILTVRNPLPCAAGPQPRPTSTGHGLIGVQERARLLGGDSHHQVRDGWFEVRTWVPW